jgi:hypothetical protein
MRTFIIDRHCISMASMFAAVKLAMSFFRRNFSATDSSRDILLTPRMTRPNPPTPSSSCTSKTPTEEGRPDGSSPAVSASTGARNGAPSEIK